MKYIITAIFAFILGVVLSGRGRVGKPVVTTDTITVRDTVRETVCKDSLVLRYVTRRLAVHDTVIRTDSVQCRDTVEVDVPITQKTYEGADYKAWVSGYEPSLDSISVAHKVVTNTVTIKERKRWGLGIHAGYGWGGKLMPYVGVGISYRLLTF